VLKREVKLHQLSIPEYNAATVLIERFPLNSPEKKETDAVDPYVLPGLEKVQSRFGLTKDI
jgi:hypothetical protein